MLTLRNKARRFLRKGQEGSTIVEFALIAPTFLMIVFSILESSVFFMHKHSLRYVVFESTRDIQTGEIQKATNPVDAFKSSFCSHTPAFMTCDNIQFDVRSFPRLSEVTFKPPQFDDDGKAENFEFSPGKQEQVTILTAAIRYNFTTPGLKEIFQSDGEPVLIVGYSIAKNEPFGCIDEC